MRKIDLLKRITGIEEFSELIYRLCKNCKDEKELADLLSQEFSEQELQFIITEASAHKDYPLSLDGLQ